MQFSHYQIYCRTYVFFFYSYYHVLKFRNGLVCCDIMMFAIFFQMCLFSDFFIVVKKAYNKIHRLNQKKKKNAMGCSSHTGSNLYNKPVRSIL